MNVYEEFTRSFLEPPTWTIRKDGIPLELFDAMTDEQKVMAEQELLKRISLNDNWPITALGYIKSIKSKDKLYILLPEAAGIMKVHIALALWRICEDETMIDIALDQSYAIKDTFSLIDLIICLHDFNVPQTIDRIKDFHNHADYLVSYNAKRLAH